jgi:hypothetical protein
MIPPHPINLLFVIHLLLCHGTMSERQGETYLD